MCVCVVDSCTRVMLMTHATQTTPGWKHGLSITMTTQEKSSNTLISGWAISTRCTSFKKERMIIISAVGFCLVFRSLAHCKILHKYCSFGGAVHILATSLHQSTQNDWTPVEQVMAHWWMLCHSALDLLANSVSSKTVQLHSCQSTMSSQLWPCTPLPCTTSLQSMKAVILGLWCDAFSPQVLSLHIILVIVSIALSVNDICMLSRRTIIWNWILTKLYLKEDSVSVSDWPEIVYLGKLISGILQSIDRRHNPRNRIWNEPICLVILPTYISIYLKVEEYEIKKKNVCRQRIWTRESDGSLNFTFISLPSPAVDENWGLPIYRLLHNLSSENDAVYDWNFLWTANSLNLMFPLFSVPFWLLFLCADFLLTSFICSLLNCEYCSSQVTPSFLAVCSLILEYAVHIFHTTDAKYVMFRVGWCKILKNSVTPSILLWMMKKKKKN